MATSLLFRLALPLGLLALPAALPAPLPAQTPIEYGAVPWSREFAAAEALAKASNKPLLVLFQEVPG